MGQIIVRPQLQGILAKEAFQRSPPASALDSFNFWPIDCKSGRLVPGTRPKFAQLVSPAGTVTMLEGVSGAGVARPFNSFATIIAGVIYYWNGSSFTSATGAQATGNDTDRLVSAAPFVNQLVITKANAKPIIFDYPSGVATTVVETAGTAPSDARIVVPWQGTVWLTGRLADPHILYAPRVGVLTDFDYAAPPEDQFGAFFTDTETAGKLSGPVNAFMPQTSDTAIISTYEGLLALRGHPRQGGVIELVGKGRYALGQGAWCKIPGDILLFLTPIGIMSLEPSPNATPALFSKEKIPEALIGLPYTYENPTVTMVYDNRWNQVHIFNRGTFEQGYTLDLGTGGFHRMSAASYPYCVTAFPTFDSEQSSGTLFGRYDGIHYFDKFATETITAGFTLNPVMLSQSTMSKGRINLVRVILGRDSPSSDLNGSMRMALGIDAQDAVSKALAGTFDYEVTLQTLKANNGVCYPKQSGQAVVFSFTHQGGDVSIEEIHMDVGEDGYNRGFRSTQFAVEGEQTNFNENITDLDVTLWAGYQLATPQVAPAGSLPDHTHFLDLSLMDTTWWDTVAPDGRDIRCSIVGGEIPADLVYFNYAGRTGLLAFKRSQTVTPAAVFVWCGYAGAVPVPAASEFGQYATYDDNWRAFYATGATADRTQYQNTRTLIAGTPGAATGPIGSAPGTDYATSVVYGDEDFIAANGLGANTAWTLVTAARKNAATSSVGQKILLSLYDGAGFSGFLSVDYTSAGTTFSVSARTSENGGSDNSSTTTSAGTVASWNHMAAVFTGTSSRTAYRNGTASVTDTTTVVNPTLVKSRAPLFDDYPGDLALSQIHDTNRSAAWVAFQAAMMTQSTFWGTIPAFVVVNAITPVSFNILACPSGIITPVETGTWSGYAAATPDAPGDSVLNVLHLIDLSALPAAWWSAVSTSGVDIRATDANNLFLPFDLVDFNKVGNTGFAVVRQNQYVTGASQIRLWVGNGTAVTVSPCALYGRYAAYEADTKAFWPGGSGVDRTQWLNNTATITPDTTGPVGNQATTYTGVEAALAEASVPATVPLTLIAAAKITSGTLFADETLVSLTGENNASAAVLKTSASPSPARLIMRRPTGTEIISGNTALVTPGNWWLQSGVAVGGTQRRVLVNGAGTPESTIEGATISGLTRATIGAQTAPDDTAFNNFNGILSLVQVHAAAKQDAWVLYQYRMLSQSTFWNTWAWTASSSALPQP